MIAPFAAAMLLAPPPGMIGENDTAGQRACLISGLLAEVLAPDLRWEIAHDDRERDGLLLAWPVHVARFRTGATSRDTGGYGPPFVVTGSLFVEPQIRWDGRDDYRETLRGAGGVRVSIHPWKPVALILESGALAARGANGGFAGAGIGIDPFGSSWRNRGDAPWLIAIVARHAWTGAGDRTDVTLDFQIPVLLGMDF